MSGAIFLTGGTGFLGMELIARMLDQGDGPDIYMAVRADDAVAAERRVADTIGRLYERPPESAGRLHAVRAELTAPGLGMSERDRRMVARDVERVVHCAASIQFTLPLEEAREINVAGTERVLELARELPQLERYVHVSTAYVSGRAPEFFDEEHTGGGDFRNTYEQTKLEAEMAVAAVDDIPTAIVRPSIVVGESDSGWTSAFNVLYWPLQAFARGVLTSVPADPHGVVDMVPVDYVADVIERVTFAADATGRYHAAAGPRAVRVDELIDAICTEMDRPRPELSEPGTLPDDHPAGVFAPYFDVKTRFGNERAVELAGPAPEPLSYLPGLLDYGTTTRWGKRHKTREAARALARAAA